MRAIVSIHDVMPATLPQTASIISRLPAVCRENLLLLVVPGLSWTQRGIDQLKAWQQQGIVLAGHGWTHEAREVRRWYHRLHALVVSRRAAEHLALCGQEIEDLMCRNSRWFGEQSLSVPDYYVPPAWALGSIDRAALVRTPFRYLETTSGILDITTGEKRLLPLVGFEADTAMRQLTLGAFNLANELVAGDQRPLRIAIHPFDFDYRLAPQLCRYVEKVSETRHYAELFDPG